MQDFIIQGEKDHRIPNLINLYGIDSPGLNLFISASAICKRFIKIIMPKKILPKKISFDLDFKWIDDVQINLSAVERRTVSLTKRRTVKKEYQAAWLLKSITLLDLTTLSGDDTFGKVDRLCQKALQPISLNILNSLELEGENILVGAVCVYHNLVSHAKKQLQDKLPIAAVSTGFPAGLSSFETRKKRNYQFN